jgi:hypothetical protein
MTPEGYKDATSAYNAAVMLAEKSHIVVAITDPELFAGLEGELLIHDWGLERIFYDVRQRMTITFQCRRG